MKTFKDLWVKEPTMCIAVVQTVIALAVAFGLSISATQTGAILAVLTAVGGLAIRSQVSSVAAMKQLKGELSE